MSNFPEIEAEGTKAFANNIQLRDNPYRSVRAADYNTEYNMYEAWNNGWERAKHSEGIKLMRDSMEFALVEGKQARRDNRPRFKNPYGRLDVQFLAWDMGWVGDSGESITHRAEWTLGEWTLDGTTTRARWWSRDGVQTSSYSVRVYQVMDGWRYKATTPDGEHGVVSEPYETRDLAESAADAWLATVCMRPRGKLEKILDDLIERLGGPVQVEPLDAETMAAIFTPEES